MSSKKFLRINKGLRIEPKNLLVPESDTAGSLEVLDIGDRKLYYRNATTTSPVVTAAHAETLTNKTIDGDDNTIQDLPITAIKVNLTDASKFMVRDASGVPTSSTKDVPTGAVLGTTDSQALTNKTIDASLNTITNISNAMFATMASLTIKGNHTGGASVPLDLNVTQVTAMLNAMVGDSGAGGTKGLVPAPAIGDATKFLRGDGTWATPPGGGGGGVPYTGATADVDLGLHSLSASTLITGTVEQQGASTLTVKTKDSTVANTQQVMLQSGDTTSTFQTGAVTLKSGDATGTGNSGGVFINSGAAPSGTRGGVEINGKQTLITAADGVLNLTAITGVMTLSSVGLTVGSSGNIAVSTAADVGANDISIASGNNIGNGSITGDISLNSGNNTGISATTGTVNITSGNATGATSNSGDIVLTIGTATSSQGKIKLVDGSEGTIGHVWTQNDNDGTGGWAAAPANSLITTSFSLAASQTNIDEPSGDLSFDTSTHKSQQLTYQIIDSNGDIRAGYMMIAAKNNTGGYSIIDDYTETATMNFAWSLAMGAGSIVKVKYTSGAETATVRATITRYGV